ncbi:MAG TPA: rod shape-determining protein MreC [Mycobacteriales bacterium]|nr:rod shape-determining protein MreC [Mycobacteriales bacterium]
MRNSRRARLVLTILLLSAFTLITIDYRSGALGGVRNAASTIFGPIEDAADAVVHPIGSFFSSLGHLNSYKSENGALRRQVAELRNKLNLTAAQRAELAQDQKLLHLAGQAQFTVVGARVTAYGATLGYEQTATINRGSANGIRVGQTVISGDGLVGRTIVVGHSSSTILLASDPTFSVGIRTAAKQLELGTVTGGGVNRPMQLQLYSNTAVLTSGEQVVTLGDSQNNDKPFAPEVPVGTISHVNPLHGGLAATAQVKPFVDFTALGVVAVVVKAPQNLKHDSLLPASPTPAPTVTVTVTGSPGTSTSPNSSTSPSSSPSTSPSRSPSP